MPVELTGNLLKELRGRACRLLSDEGWTQSKLGKALGISQVMAGNYLHTLPTQYNEPIESNLQESSFSLAEILKAGEASTWSLKIVVDDQDLIINFPVQDTKEKILIRIADMRKRLETVIFFSCSHIFFWEKNIPELLISFLTISLDLVFVPCPKFQNATLIH